MENEYDIDEMIKLFINNNIRDDEIEDDVIEKFALFFNNEIPFDEIKYRLYKSNFKGIYLASDEEYENLIKNKEKKALYRIDEKAIISSLSNVEKNDDILIHEMVHALIDNKLAKNIHDICNDLSGEKGHGFEEGVASTISSSCHNNDKDFISYSDSYVCQVGIVEQINFLYNFYSKKKYSSFLLHVIKEPVQTLNLLFDIYNDIIEQKFALKLNNNEINRKDTLNIAYKTANDIIVACDSMLEPDISDYDIKNLFFLASRLNYDYLLLVKDEILFNNEYVKELELFPKAIKEETKMSGEEKLLSILFNDKTLLHSNLLIELYKIAGNSIPNYYENNIDSIAKQKKYC